MAKWPSGGDSTNQNSTYLNHSFLFGETRWSVNRADDLKCGGASLQSYSLSVSPFSAVQASFCVSPFLHPESRPRPIHHTQMMCERASEQGMEWKSQLLITGCGCNRLTKRVSGFASERRLRKSSMVPHSPEKLVSPMSHLRQARLDRDMPYVS